MTRARHWLRAVWRSRLRLLFTLAVLGAPACRITDVPLWGLGGPPLNAFEVEEVRDVTYCEEPGTDPHRHQLDLFLPKGPKEFPVVVLVHGGAWVMGDN